LWSGHKFKNHADTELYFLIFDFHSRFVPFLIVLYTAPLRFLHPSFSNYVFLFVYLSQLKNWNHILLIVKMDETVKTNKSCESFVVDTQEIGRDPSAAMLADSQSKCTTAADIQKNE
jgi:hypothetical protein